MITYLRKKESIKLILNGSGFMQSMESLPFLYERVVYGNKHKF